VAIPATGDSFTGLSNIIRVRFPEFGVWSLPIVAHEFGHYLQAEKREQKFPYLFNEILSSEGQAFTDQPDPILQEQFADLFAVYVLGPAYACTCILLEFNPRTADRDAIGHPSDARRVFFLLRALEKLQEHDCTKPYDWIITQLNKRWGAGVRAAKSQPLTKKELQQLGKRFDTLYEVLANPANQLAAAPYGPDRWSLVRPLAGELGRLAATHASAYEAEGRVRKVLEGQKGPAVVPDLLNAAWLCRLLDDQSDPRVISRLALPACRSLLNRK